MKTILILLFSSLIIPLSFSQDDDCEQANIPEEAKSLAGLAMPNCFNNINAMMAKRGRTEALCEDCRKEFESRYPERINGLSKKEVQEKVFEASILEYKKTIVSNLVTAMRLRNLPSTGAKFDKASVACNMQISNEQLKSCSSNSAKELLKSTPFLGKLNQEITNEIAKMLDPNVNVSPTLLSRTNTQCSYSEKDVLLFTSLATEKAFKPELVANILKLNPADYSSVDELFLQDLGFPKEFLNGLLISLKTHPILKSKIATPSSLISFLKSLPSPTTTENFRNAIYSKTEGIKLDEELASQCDKAFKSFQNTICSKDFENGDIDLEPFKHISKISSNDLEPSGSDYAVPENVLNNNLEVLRLCKTEMGKGPKLSELLGRITPDLDENLKEANYSAFTVQKFNQDIGNIKDLVCKSTNESCKDKQDFTCEIFERFNEAKKPGTLEHSLANSSNKEVNNLLRSMIGSPTNLDSKTREILVLQGILPKSDGTMVAQAEIPERQPGYFNKPTAQSAPAAPTVTKVVNTQPGKTSLSNRSQNSMTNEIPANYQTHVGSALTPDFSDLLDQSDSNLRDVQNEIMRRLAALPNKKPETQVQAKQIARDSLKSKGMSNPSLENALASRLMGTSQPQETTPAAAASDNFFDKNHKQVASSSTQTAAEKYKNDGMNRALSEMHGARAVAANATSGSGRGPASSDSTEAADKPLSTVALSLPEDPKVSLGSVFSEKLNKNDPETQMLKVLMSNKKDFILQINSVNFRVVFDENKRMNILLDSGDKNEAMRIRPQLEIFFKRLGTI